MRDDPDSNQKVTELITAMDQTYTRIVKAAHIQNAINLQTLDLNDVLRQVGLTNRPGRY